MSHRSASSSLLHIINLTDTKVTEQHFDFYFFFFSLPLPLRQYSVFYMTTLAEKRCFIFLLCFLLLVFLFSFYMNACWIQTKCNTNVKCRDEAVHVTPVWMFHKTSFIIKHKFRKLQGCRTPGPVTRPGTSQCGILLTLWAGCTDCWCSFLWSFVVFVWPRLRPICFFKTLTGTNCSWQYSSRGH